MAVILPKSVFTRSGTVYQVPDATTKAVDDFEAPSGYRRDGARESSFMYSLGFFLRPLDTKDPECKYFYLADAKCRSAKTAIPCRSGDRGNVNKHHKKNHEAHCLKLRWKRRKKLSLCTSHRKPYDIQILIQTFDITNRRKKRHIVSMELGLPQEIIILIFNF